MQKYMIIFINFCRSYCAFDYLVINLNSISCILFISHIHIHLFLLASHSRHMYALAYLFFSSGVKEGLPREDEIYNAVVDT